MGHGVKHHRPTRWWAAVGTSSCCGNPRIARAAQLLCFDQAAAQVARVGRCARNLLPLPLQRALRCCAGHQAAARPRPGASVGRACCLTAGRTAARMQGFKTFAHVQGRAGARHLRGCRCPLSPWPPTASCSAGDALCPLGPRRRPCLLQMPAIQRLMGALCFAKRAAAGRPSPYADLTAADLWGDLGEPPAPPCLYAVEVS